MKSGDGGCFGNPPSKEVCWGIVEVFVGEVLNRWMGPRDLLQLPGKRQTKKCLETTIINSEPREQTITANGTATFRPTLEVLATGPAGSGSHVHSFTRTHPHPRLDAATRRAFPGAAAFQEVEADGGLGLRQCSQGGGPRLGRGGGGGRRGGRGGRGAEVGHVWGCEGWADGSERAGGGPNCSGVRRESLAASTTAGRLAKGHNPRTSYKLT